MTRIEINVQKGTMMRKTIWVILVAVILCLGACAADQTMPGMALAAEQSANAAVVINDEEIPLAEPISFDEEINQVASIPTHVGGGIQLKINGVLYDVCYGFGELALEKGSQVYELWDTGLIGVVETATGKTLDELCAYSVTMDGKEYTVDGWTRKTIFDILTSVYSSKEAEGADKTGECVVFRNKMGADFDLYLDDDIIYSPYLDACFDISAYHGDFDDMLSSLK
jgi:hypothetical protein